MLAAHIKLITLHPLPFASPPAPCPCPHPHPHPPNAQSRYMFRFCSINKHIQQKGWFAFPYPHHSHLSIQVSVHRVNYTYIVCIWHLCTHMASYYMVYNCSGIVGWLASYCQHRVWQSAAEVLRKLLKMLSDSFDLFALVPAFTLTPIHSYTHTLTLLLAMKMSV